MDIHVHVLAYVRTVSYHIISSSPQPIHNFSSSSAIVCFRSFKHTHTYTAALGLLCSSVQPASRHITITLCCPHHRPVHISFVFNPLLPFSVFAFVICSHPNRPVTLCLRPATSVSKLSLRRNCSHRTAHRNFRPRLPPSSPYPPSVDHPLKHTTRRTPFSQLHLSLLRLSCSNPSFRASLRVLPIFTFILVDFEKKKLNDFFPRFVFTHSVLHHASLTCLLPIKSSSSAYICRPSYTFESVLHIFTQFLRFSAPPPSSINFFFFNHVAISALCRPILRALHFVDLPIYLRACVSKLNEQNHPPTRFLYIP